MTRAAALQRSHHHLEAQRMGDLDNINKSSCDETSNDGSSQGRRKVTNSGVHTVKVLAGGIRGILFGPPSPDASSKVVHADKEQPGSLLKVKRVDEVYDPMRGNYVVRKSIIQAKSPEKDAFEAFAFTFTRRFDHSMENSTSTIDIRSEWLKEVGRNVVGPVSGISWTAKPLKVDPQVLIAFLPALEDHTSKLQLIENPSTDDLMMRKHLEFFVSALRNEYSATLSELSSLLLHEEINFDLLYALFVPGTILYFPCPVSKAPRAGRLVDVRLYNSGCMRYWKLDAEYVEYNSGGAIGSTSRGKDSKIAQFGFAKLTLMVPGFEGTKKISNLAVFPFEYFPTATELKARLAQRGKKWTELQGMYHKYHSGIAFQCGAGGYSKVNCNSRIMVDWVTFSQTSPNYRLPTVTKTLAGEEINWHASASNADTDSVTSLEELCKNAPQEWNDKLLMLCSPLTYGFSLTDKLWLEFNVDNIYSIEWNDEPFENLMLTNDAKRLVKSLVETHGVNDAAFDDFVKGKGQGLVINLFGNPGVGKTLTAEATSEYARKPLYVVGAADLGTTASALDSNLTLIFSLSSTWGAVVLIDEADVFLEERSLHDLERNAMVAVFLRQLEYFRGILFLTTNRVRTFDGAFQSRIHVSLRYQDLTEEARQHIWAAFLKKARTLEARDTKHQGESSNTILTEYEMRKLASRNVNGRQIKNAVRTASALARSSGENISYAHLAQVLDLMEAFELGRDIV